MTREPTEIELRVAKALEKYRALEPQHSDYIRAARAAIRAMREPTTKMLREAGMKGVCSTPDVAYMWGEMIDAALSGGE